MLLLREASVLCQRLLSKSFFTPHWGVSGRCDRASINAPYIPPLLPMLERFAPKIGAWPGIEKVVIKLAVKANCVPDVSIATKATRTRFEPAFIAQSSSRISSSNESAHPHSMRISRVPNLLNQRPFVAD